MVPLKYFPVIDLYAAFVDEQGLMNEAYTTDGVHLNDIGYKAWVEYVNKYVQLFKSPLYFLRKG